MILLERLRTLTLREPSRPGRPAHVSAASGLVRAGDRLYVVADDENELGMFPATGAEHGSLVSMLEGALPLEADARKRGKPDFESLVRLPPYPGAAQGALFALGSCSTRNRCSGVLLGLDRIGELARTRTRIDLAPLREALDGRVAGLNIEGAVVLGGELVLLQRANKGNPLNARIRLRLDQAIASLAGESRIGIEGLIGIEEVDLGAVEGVPLGFSDGSALADGRMAFTAIAEDTSDSYRDGPCLGAAIGILGRNGGVERLEMIDPCHKVEGIDATLEGDLVRALLVTDADDPRIPASLLRCELSQGHLTLPARAPKLP